MTVVSACGWRAWSAGLLAALATWAPGRAAEPELQPYAFRTDAAAPAPAAGSMEDLILAIDRLEGVTLVVRRGLRPAPCSAAGPPEKLIACELTARLSALLTAANAADTRQSLTDLKGWMAGGVYAMASDFGEATQRFIDDRARPDVEQQLRLGSTETEHMMATVRALDIRRLGATEARLSFRSGAGAFSFQRGAIVVDTVGLKRLVIADYAQRYGVPAKVSDCLGRPAPAGFPFCANVLARLRAAEGDEAPGQVRARAAAGGFDEDGWDARLFPSWRRSLGLAFVEAYLDETWSYLAAAAMADRQDRIAQQCPATGVCQGVSDGVYAARYLAKPRERMMTQLSFVMAHELGHQLLGHAARTAAAGEDECLTGLGLEAQADIVAALLNRRLDETPAEPAAAGAVYERPPEAASEAAASENATYVEWSPFFDGYVGLFESGSERCGYFSGLARHILVYVLYTGPSLERR